MISKQFAIDVRLKRDEVPSFDEYPFSLAAVRHLDLLPLHPRVTYLVGENGTGKSTLLEAIAVANGFNAEVRRPRDGFFLRAESFFNVATEIERLDAEGMGPRVIDSYGGKSLHEQSHARGRIVATAPAGGARPHPRSCQRRIAVRYRDPLTDSYGLP